MAILSVVLAQMATYDTCETQWAVLHFDPATAKITRNNLGGRGDARDRAALACSFKRGRGVAERVAFIMAVG